MSDLSANGLLVIFAIVCVLLIIKAQVLGAATAATRGKLKKFITQEDANWLGGDYVSVDDELAQRLFRAQRNDLENLLPFFIGGTLYIQSGATTSIGIAYICVFLLARYLHTFAYLKRKARLRRDAYTLGWAMTIIMSLHAAAAMLLATLM